MFPYFSLDDFKKAIVNEEIRRAELRLQADKLTAEQSRLIDELDKAKKERDELRRQRDALAAVVDGIDKAFGAFHGDDTGKTDHYQGLLASILDSRLEGKRKAILTAHDAALVRPLVEALICLRNMTTAAAEGCTIHEDDAKREIIGRAGRVKAPRKGTA
mgnify:CR=1 FL=1